MALTHDDIAHLNDKAEAVGKYVGRALKFIEAPNRDFVVLTCGDNQTVIAGPYQVSELGFYEVDAVLDRIAKGQAKIFDNEDGHPCLADDT